LDRATFEAGQSNSEMSSCRNRQMREYTTAGTECSVSDARNKEFTVINNVKCMQHLIFLEPWNKQFHEHDCNGSKNESLQELSDLHCMNRVEATEIIQ